ncbi:MAG: hypothetical protein WD928_15570 [Gammaproteobacteria bacterium]
MPPSPLIVTMSVAIIDLALLTVFRDPRGAAGAAVEDFAQRIATPRGLLPTTDGVAAEPLRSLRLPSQRLDGALDLLDEPAQFTRPGRAHAVLADPQRSGIFRSIAPKLFDLGKILLMRPARTRDLLRGFAARDIRQVDDPLDALRPRHVPLPPVTSSSAATAALKSTASRMF